MRLFNNSAAELVRFAWMSLEFEASIRIYGCWHLGHLQVCRFEDINILGFMGWSFAEKQISELQRCTR